MRDAARAELIDEDMRALPLIVRRLAEAQERTDASLEQLTEAQGRTEARLESLAAKVDELAEAQRNTEARLDSLAANVAESRRGTAQHGKAVPRGEGGTRFASEAAWRTSKAGAMR